LQGQNRDFVRLFLEGSQPEDNFHTGLEVTELLMTCYMSAEEERAVRWKPDVLDSFIPAVAQRTWDYRQ
jgi:hypothetical protein